MAERNQRSYTSPSTQSTLHEFALALPPPRKQNVACDTCRARKVKCVRLPSQDKHCQVKNYACTHVIQQATSEKRRGSHPKRRVAPSDPSSSATVAGSSGNYAPGVKLNHPSPLPHPIVDDQSSSVKLIKYLFNPNEPDLSHRGRSGSLTSVSMSDDWQDIGKKLLDERYCVEFALDLVEVFFQICHTRMPLLNPNHFRSRLQADLPRQITSVISIQIPKPPVQHGNDPINPLHPALLASVLAWGAKFSEHPILVTDRANRNGRSRIAKMLYEKALEIAEVEKVHRIPSSDHVITSLLLEPLQGHGPNDPEGFRGFWLSSAIRQLFILGINRRSTTENILDAQTKGALKYAWWMACLGDAYGAVFFRWKPLIEDVDYDIDLLDSLVADRPPFPPRQGVPASAQSQFFGWYTAAHSMARCIREISRQLWRPGIEADGIAFEQLSQLVTPLHQWRDEFLVHVGVPSNFQADWDFVAAVSACTSDAQYHVMWVILHNAVEEFGIREANYTQNQDSVTPELPIIIHIEELKSAIANEAVHGALRIAGLARVLASNGYLRLDPNVLHFAIYTAGVALAKLGKLETQYCIEGLRQYGYAFEEAFDQATEIERIYGQALLANSGTTQDSDT